MAFTERGRVLATTSTVGQVAGVAVAWHRGKGLLGSILSAVVGGLVGAVAGQAFANVAHLPAGLVAAGHDGDAPEKTAVDGDEIDGYVANSQRPYYDVLATAKVAREDKFQPIAFFRTVAAPDLTT